MTAAAHTALSALGLKHTRDAIEWFLFAKPFTSRMDILWHERVICPFITLQVWAPASARRIPWINLDFNFTRRHCQQSILTSRATNDSKSVAAIPIYFIFYIRERRAQNISWAFHVS